MLIQQTPFQLFALFIVPFSTQFCCGTHAHKAIGITAEGPEEKKMTTASSSASSTSSLHPASILSLKTHPKSPSLPLAAGASDASEEIVVNLGPARA